MRIKLYKGGKSMKIYIYMSIIVLLNAAEAYAQSGQTATYRVTARQQAFDKLINSKKYAFVLFYKFDQKEKDQKLSDEERERYKQLSAMFRDISQDAKYKNRSDLVFVEVNVANKDGVDIYNNFSSAQSLPAYVFLKDGKEVKDWGQTYNLTGALTREQLESFLDDMLK